MEEFLHRVFDDQMRSDGRYVVYQSCLWEAATRKIGNVHPGRAFADMTFLDFCTSAGIVGAKIGGDLGPSVYRVTLATQCVVGKNTNLGITLLLAPLLAVRGSTAMTSPAPCSFYHHADYIAAILESTTVNDAELVYQSIRLANPGGLGTADKQDVSEKPTVTLLEAMRLAADRDLIARQYANNYSDVFDLGVPTLLDGFERFGCMEAAIIHCQFAWMAAFPDSLIARKNGLAVAKDVQQRMLAVVALGGLSTPKGRATGVALDTHLRSDGNKLNPGTTADLVAACLFVALREGKLKLNAPFAWNVEDWL